MTTTDLIALCELVASGNPTAPSLDQHASEIEAHLRHFIQTDDRLRAVYSGASDGDEKDVEEQLERNTDLFHGIRRPT
jgi:hypothetical protein